MAASLPTGHIPKTVQIRQHYPVLLVGPGARVESGPALQPDCNSRCARAVSQDQAQIGTGHFQKADQLWNACSFPAWQSLCIRLQFSYPASSFSLATQQLGRAITSPGCFLVRSPSYMFCKGTGAAAIHASSPKGDCVLRIFVFSLLSSNLASTAHTRTLLWGLGKQQDRRHLCPVTLAAFNQPDSHLREAYFHVSPKC